MGAEQSRMCKTNCNRRVESGGESSCSNDGMQRNSRAAGRKSDISCFRGLLADHKRGGGGEEAEVSEKTLDGGKFKQKKAEDGSSHPSPYAATLVTHLRRSAMEKNCNVIQDQQNQGNSVSESEALTREVLLEIIRCFPFPSPRGLRKSSSNLTSTKTHEMPLKRSLSSNATKFFSRKNNERKVKEDLLLSASDSNSIQVALRNVAMKSVDTMAITALPLDCWLRERLKHWVQLSGHDGTIVPASDSTLWKKRSGTDCNEATSYRKLMNDVLCPFVPKFTKEVDYKGESFIEIEDLTSHFKDPAIMDIKIGTRTFLESEVKNPVSRKDLYQKMIKIDPSEPTEEEHALQAVTKLRYMQFRERESSTATLGFRVEAMKRPGCSLDRSFQKVKTREEVMEILCKYMGTKASVVRDPLLKRLKSIRSKVEGSEFFKTHEVIGSSLLFMFDDHLASIWMIDFAKSLPVDNGRLDHRSLWVVGNHEDGYLTGLDCLIQILEDTRHKELSTL